MSEHTSLLKDPVSLEPEKARGMMMTGLGVGGLLLLVSIAGGLATDKDQFFFSWLTGFAYVTTITLGLLFFTLIQHVVAARWSVVVRRLAEAAIANIPLLIVYFIPVLMGMHSLYHWTHEDVATDAILAAKSPYLNVPFFLIRAAIFLGAWTIIGQFFFKNSVRQDTEGGHELTLKMRRIAAPSLFVFALTLTFSGIDWFMSLDPHWYSTIFGPYMFAGSAVSSFSMLVFLTRRVQANGGLLHSVNQEHFHDLGKLMFAFTVFWTYIGFSQYFLIWYSNIPEETIWFLHRWNSGWKTISLMLPVCHFVIPFVALLSRYPKRNPAFLTVMAVWILVMHYVDMYWLIMPTHHPENPHFHWLDITTVLGMVGVWYGLWAWRLTRVAVLPVQDPLLPESLEFQNV